MICSVSELIPNQAMRVEVDVSADQLDLEDGDRLVRRQVQGGSGDQGELRAVRPALERLVLDETLGQRDLAVRAGVADGVDVSTGILHHGDRHTADDDADGLVDDELVGRADTLAHQPATAAELSSSASMAACSRSCRAGDPICWTISARKPRTTSRRASSSVIPRDCR